MRWLLGSLLVVLVVSCGFGVPVHRGEGGNVLLGVNMFVWYGFEPGTGVSVGGLGSEHWNSNAINEGRRTGALPSIYDPIVATPELGFYVSDDPDVIAQQVAWMRDVGVDVIMVNWWGWGDDDLDGAQDNPGRAAIDRATKALFDHIEQFGGAIKAFVQSENWMIPVEQWDAGAPVYVDAAKSQLIWNHVNDNYVAQYPNSYFQWEGKPLFVSGAPHVLVADNQARFTYKKLWPVLFSETGIHQGEMDWSWVDPAAVSGGLDYKAEVISADGMVVITNRRDQYWGWIQGLIAGDPDRRDPFLEDGLGDTNWKLVFGARDQVNLVMIQTWNDYHEMSFIEPASDGRLGSKDPVDLLDKTKYYWELFKAGESFVDYRHKQLWAQPDVLRQFMGNLEASELGMVDKAEVDAFLASLLSQAQNLIEEDIGRVYTPEDVPAGLVGIELRLASNMYNYVQMNKRNPVMQVGEFNFQLNDDGVFTTALRRDLRLYRERRVLGVIR